MDRILARLAAAVAAPVLVLALAGPAAAHVTITPSTDAAGADVVLAVRVPHGCEGSSTTAVTLRIPEGVTAVRPVESPRWEHEVGSGQVTFRAVDALADDERDVFRVAVRLPDRAGETLVFPVIQTCEQGEVAWIEVAEPGQDPDDLDRPAPVLVLTGAGGSPAEILATASSGLPESESSVAVPALVYGALALGVLATLAALAVLARQRRRA